MFICIGHTIYIYFIRFRRVAIGIHNLQVHTRTHAPAIAGYYYYFFRFFEVSIAQTAALNSHTPTRKIPITKRHEEEDSSNIQNIVLIHLQSRYTSSSGSNPNTLSQLTHISSRLFLVSFTLVLAGRPSLPLLLISRIQRIDKNYDQIVSCFTKFRWECMHETRTHTLIVKIACVLHRARARTHAHTKSFLSKSQIAVVGFDSLLDFSGDPKLN